MAYTTIDDPSAYFQTLLYTGNGGSQTMTNDGNSDLQPDFLWIKQRSGTENHYLGNSSIANKFLNSDRANAESTNVSGKELTYNSDGFAFAGSDSTWNGSSSTYVAWQWKANGGTESGSFSEVGTNPGVSFQANTDAGFSICTYTGTGGNGSFAHGLGVAPEWIIVKGRDIATDGMVYHGANTSAPETDALTLPETSATSDNAGWWNDTAPTSSSVYIGTHDRVNSDGNTYVAYCFAPIKGYSKFGSYTGNASADGPFVYTGFKPSWVVIKNIDATANWHMYDNKRDATNPVETAFQANSSGAEFTTSNKLDFVSNGFKIRAGNQVSTNHDGVNYIYMAFAESPFVSSEGVPTTAR